MWQVSEIQVVTCDLDEDGRDERVAVLLDDNDLYKWEPLTLPRLIAGIGCRGFAVFKCIDGTWWPALYQYFDFDGRDLRLDWIDGLACMQLVSDGGRDAVKFWWEWNQLLDETWFTPAWAGQSCAWDREAAAYGQRTCGSPMWGGVRLK
jgi:hypothetical protein